VPVGSDRACAITTPELSPSPFFSRLLPERRRQSPGGSSAPSTLASQCPDTTNEPVDAPRGGLRRPDGRERDRLAGIETADSVTFNPQKWGASSRFAVALFADTAVLADDVQVGASDMREGATGPTLCEPGRQGTRHADVLNCGSRSNTSSGPDSHR
jgi:hypothetical protein